MDSRPDGSLVIEQVGDYLWRIPPQGAMRVPGLVFADHRLLEAIRADSSLEQVANVACLPGIVGNSLAMPDVHSGYGFPVGAVAAFDPEEGVVSPGGVGYDINCGVRLLASDIDYREVAGRVGDLTARLAGAVPGGVGSARKDLRLDRQAARRVARQGAAWAVEHGLGSAEDLEATEDGGVISGADPELVTDRAYDRGRDQLGTLGSGNHFLEIGYADEIYQPEAASRLGLHRDRLTVLIHTGSRGFGHQVCDDHLRALRDAPERYRIELPDRQLACAPVDSEEGRCYLSAMACAANFAFANRQVITHLVREAVEEVWGMTPRRHGLRVVYDVCHNIAKLETHRLDGRDRRLVVHRKGATRAFPPGHPAVPEAYRAVGQPVLVPGDMGRYSYVLVGHPQSPEWAFASSCHGAGRLLSRGRARQAAGRRDLFRELKERGVQVVAATRATLDEEYPEAYKDVREVVEVVEGARLALRVARLRPAGVVRG